MLKRLLSDLAVQGLVSLGLSKVSVACPVCGGKTKSIGKVDFNRSCEDEKERVFEQSKKLVEYCLCIRCRHCFAPEFLTWSNEKFLSEIYNDDYVLVDPELSEIRPERVAQGLEQLFGPAKSLINHLDYGGGPGTLSKLLVKNGWKSSSCDPFFPTSEQSDSGKHDLVTSIEVFEHVPHPRNLVEQLITRLRPDGVLYFSTLLSDSVQLDDSLLDWWYLAPRNGHVSLFSSNSLRMLFGIYDFKLLNVSQGVHIAYRRLPQWCQRLEAFSSLYM